jgi:hypothetical protein
MALFRFHRGGLQESLLTTKIVKNKDELLQLIKDEFKEFEGLEVKEIIIERYADQFGNNFDYRIGWYTHIVKAKLEPIENEQVIGFLSEDLLVK